MDNNNRYRIICLALVLCLVVVMAPHPKALDPITSNSLWVAAESVARSMLGSMGIFKDPKIGSTSFDDSVVGIVNEWAKHGYIGDGRVPLTIYTGEDGKQQYYIAEKFINAAAKYITTEENNVVHTGLPNDIVLHPSVAKRFDSWVLDYKHYCIVHCVSSTDSPEAYYFFGSDSPLNTESVPSSPGTRFTVFSSDKNAYVYLLHCSDQSISGGIGSRSIYSWVYGEIDFFYTDNDVVLSDGFVGGNVIHSNEEVKDRYQDWAAKRKVTHAGDGVLADPVESDATDQTAEGHLPISVTDQIDAYVAVSVDDAVKKQEALQQGDVISESVVIPGTDVDVPVESKTLADYILNGIRGIFFPSEDFLTVKLDYLLARFPFVKSIVDSVRSLKVALFPDNPEPPVIWVETQNSTGKWDWGERTPILDMSFYAPYKPKVDIILSGCLWAVFIWKVFMKLPGIIGGDSGDVEFISVSDDKRSRSNFDGPRLPSGRG